MSDLCAVGAACLKGEAAYYPGSTFFIDPEAMTPMQLLWAFGSYGYVLFISANMIGDGAELLLLIPEYKDLVASVVLPILGAVPDGMMVLFSGIGPLAAAQENVAVGVGALAGSTIMLLTLPWVLSFYGGKVDFDTAGNLDKAYDAKKSLRDTGGFLSGGVEFLDGAKANAKIMMVTCLAYFFIQIPALMVDDQKTKDQYPDDKAYIEAVISESSAVHGAALIGAIVTAVLLAGYLALQVKAASAAQDADKDIESNAPVPYGGFLPAPAKVMKDGWLEEKGIRMHIEYLRDRAKEEHCTDNSVAINTVYTKFIEKQKSILSSEMNSELKTLFKKYAKRCAPSTSIGSKDMLEALSTIGLNYTPEKFDSMFKEADKDKSGTLEEFEFIDFFSRFIIFSAESLPWHQDGGADGDEDDDDEMPDEFKNLSPADQKKAILKDSLYQMLVGTLLVLLFSDPMVDVLGAMAKMTGVPAFYVAFVLSPLASNASELVASFKLASKKSKESITQSLQTLEGAAIMNNTFCLGIFYVLIYVQGLAWKFTAETISIVLVQVLVGAMVLLKSKQGMIMGLIVFSFYPLSLLIVAYLEAHGID